MPSIILNYTLYLPTEKRIGIKRIKGCKSRKEAITRLKRELELKHKDIIKVEF